MNMTMAKNEYKIEDHNTFEANSLGELLKRSRERQGISLKDVANKTKVHIGILSQLENNNLENLPSKPYVKGFIRSASIFLGINPKVALGLLEEAYCHIIFDDQDLVAAPPISMRENSILKNLSVLKKQKSFLDKISIQQLSVLMLIIVGTLIGLITYFNSTIKSNILPSAQTSKMAPPAQTAKNELNSVGIDANQLILSTMTAMLTPKSLESMDRPDRLLYAHSM